MFARRVLLCFKALPIPVLVLLLVSYWMLHSMRVEAQVSQSSRVRELQEQRLATLRKLVKITADDLRHGLASADELWSATRAREEAELELCTSNRERIALLERAVADARLLEEQDAKLAANQLLPETSLLKATALRLQQEIRLEHEKAK